MPHQSEDEARRIAAHHLPRLSQADQLIIVARCRNWGSAQIANMTGYSVKHAERKIAWLSDLIVGPLGPDRHGWFQGEWTCVHAQCCLLAGWQQYWSAAG